MTDFSPSQIKELRELRGFTQKRLAEILDISLKALSNYELGRRTPDGVTFYKLSCISPTEELSKYFFQRAGLTEERLSDLTSDLSKRAVSRKAGPEYLKYMTHPGVVIAGKQIDVVAKALSEKATEEALIPGSEIVRILMKSPLGGALGTSWIDFSVVPSSREKESLFKLFRVLRSHRLQTKTALEAHIRDAFDSVFEPKADRKAHRKKRSKK